MTAKLIGKEWPERYSALTDETPTFQVSGKANTLARTNICAVGLVAISQRP